MEPQTMEPQTLPIAHLRTGLMQIVRRGRFWAVHDGAGQLICVAVYRKGAREVVRRLSPAREAEETSPEAEESTERAVPARERKDRENGTRHASDDRHR